MKNTNRALHKKRCLEAQRARREKERLRVEREADEHYTQYIETRAGFGRRKKR